MEENEEEYETIKSRYRTDDTDSDLNKPQWVFFIVFYLVLPLQFTYYKGDISYNQRSGPFLTLIVNIVQNLPILFFEIIIFQSY